MQHTASNAGRFIICATFERHGNPKKLGRRSQLYEKIPTKEIFTRFHYATAVIQNHQLLWKEESKKRTKNEKAIDRAWRGGRRAHVLAEKNRWAPWLNVHFS